MTDESAVQPLSDKEPQKIKSGIWTTEFWLTAGSVLSAMLVLLGFVKSADATAFTDSVDKAIAAAFALVAQMRYLQTRLKLKTSHVEAEVEAIKASSTTETKATSSPEGTVVVTERKAVGNYESKEKAGA
jgi:hypothetical protein